MSRGKRYNAEKQLNMKKVLGVVVTIVLIILFIVCLKKILKDDKTTLATKNVELAYYPVFSNGNWGIINSSGNIIIQPAYAEMIMVPNKSKSVFICTYDVNYVDGTYKTKAINEKNEQLFTEYENVTTIQNHDENNNLWYEDNILKVQKDGKFGLINLSGNVLLNCEYDSISALPGISNSILVKKDGKVGISNLSGSLIVPVEYTEVLALTEEHENGYIVKNAEGNYGIISNLGITVLDCIYGDIKHTTDGDMYIVKSNGTWKVMHKDGSFFLEGKVDGATEINGGNVVAQNNGKYGIYNIETDLKVPQEYEDIKYAFDDKYIAKKNGKYGVINLNNQALIDFNYDYIEYNKKTDYIKAQRVEGTFDYINRNLEIKVTAGNEKILNGYIELNVQGETKYYNYQLSEKSNKEAFSTNTLFITKQNGKYGFTDKNGKIIVDCIYEDAREQNDSGYCAVKANGKWGAIDQQGKVVISPMYNINDANRIDFIGRWYAGADKNANYYTDAN